MTCCCFGQGPASVLIHNSTFGAKMTASSAPSKASGKDTKEPVAVTDDRSLALDVITPSLNWNSPDACPDGGTRTIRVTTYTAIFTRFASCTREHPCRSDIRSRTSNRGGLEPPQQCQSSSNNRTPNGPASTAGECQKRKEPLDKASGHDGRMLLTR